MDSTTTIAGTLERALARQRHVRLALLFGSTARGEARPGSDVDVAVLAPGADLLGLAAELSDALAADVDVVSLEGAGVPLLEEILRDGIVVHEGTPGQGASWRARVLCDLELDRPWFRRMRDAWLARVADEGL